MGCEMSSSDLSLFENYITTMSLPFGRVFAARPLGLKDKNLSAWSLVHYSNDRSGKGVSSVLMLCIFTVCPLKNMGTTGLSEALHFPSKPYISA